MMVDLLASQELSRRNHHPEEGTASDNDEKHEQDGEPDGSGLRVDLVRRV